MDNKIATDVIQVCNNMIIELLNKQNEIHDGLSVTKDNVLADLYHWEKDLRNALGENTKGM